MNPTNWQHALIAAGMMLALGLVLTLLSAPGAWLIGFAVAVTWFIARECTQHEYKIATQRGWRWGRNLPVRWWEGVAKGWSRDSLLDWLTPLLACLLLLIVIGWLPTLIA